MSNITKNNNINEIIAVNITKYDCVLNLYLQYFSRNDPCIGFQSEFNESHNGFKLDILTINNNINQINIIK